MGVDIVSVGMRHKLGKKPLDLIKIFQVCLMQTSKYYITITTREESYVSLLDFKKKSATENYDQLPRSNYLQQHTFQNLK